MAQIGHYAPSEVRYFLEHDGNELAEIQSFEFDIDPSVEAGGKGLGFQKNAYWKITDAPKMAGKIGKNVIARADRGMLFMDLIRGSSVIHQDVVAAAATTATLSLVSGFTSLIEVKNTANNLRLREGIDYTVNYTTGVITFPAALSDAVLIKYLVQGRRGLNYLANGGFEDALGTTWIGFATGTVARDSTAANTYSELYGLKVTPTAVSDGVQYNLPIYLPQGRTYRLRGRAKAAAAEVLAAFWYDGTTDQAMTVVSGATLTTTFTPFEFTFTTTTKSTIANIKIKDTKTGPAVFYLDDLMLIDDTTATNPTYGFNPMDHGMAIVPFEFNIVARRVVDGTAIYKIMDATVDKIGIKSGKAYAEDISFQALDLVYE